MKVKPETELRAKRVQAAQGKIECDELFINAKYLDVFHQTWKVGTIAIFDGYIVGVEEASATSNGARFPAKKITDFSVQYPGQVLVPGFIDAHVHIESSLMTPAHFEQMALKRGTTTAICDPHELANVVGTQAFEYFLSEASISQMNLQVMLSSCVPATHLETNGGGVLKMTDLEPFVGHPHALGLAEVMNVPAVLGGDPEMWQKLDGFLDRAPIDGHSPLLRGQALSAYLCAGINSCHESSELKEAEEKISKGMSVWIREGSVAKDLKTLISVLKPETASSVGFCTDDRNPLDIEEEGHLDYLIRQAIKNGIQPELAYRAVSLSVAQHYGLSNVGAIAPGRRADLVLLSNVADCSVSEVWAAGKQVSASSPRKAAKTPADLLNTVKVTVPTEADLMPPEGQVHVIVVIPGKIITDRKVSAHSAEGVCPISVLGRYKRGAAKPANAYVSGFGKRFNSLGGAIGSSVGHDSHNLIVVGMRASDRKAALEALVKMQGGFVVIKDGKVMAQLELPLGGIMSLEEPHVISEKLKKLREASKAIGCELQEPFLQLAFLSLPVIPKLKLTDLGLVDVEQFKLIDVQAKAT